MKNVRQINNTDYPHLDNKHYQFYSDAALKFQDDPNIDTIAKLLNSSFAELGNDYVIMEYYGRKITVGEFLKNKNDYSAAFLNMGIRPGEVVSIASPNLPEVFYAIYALNEIGATANLIDPRNNLGRIKQFINQVNSTKLIMLDIVYPKIEKIIGETNLKKVYTISAADSLPLGLNFIQRAKTVVESCRKRLKLCPNNEVFTPLKESVAKYKDMKIIHSEIDYLNKKDRHNDTAIIVNTSGTTGTPKGVELTNDNLNSVAYDYMYSGMDYEKGDSFLGIMPNFLAYGAGVGMHMPFVLGLKNIIVPQLKPEDFPKLIVKHLPNHFAGVPDHYQHLIESKKAQRARKKGKFACIKTAAAGGCGIVPELKMKVNEFIAPQKLKVGYGCTENTGVAASQFYVGESNSENELTTVGIPVLNTEFRIVSPETGEDLKCNQLGEILLTGRGVAKGYVNNPEETKEVFEVIDGKRYIHTKDIGYIDESGAVYVIDRIKRIIIRPDGHNVFPSYIENVITKHPFVRACACVGLKTKSSVNGRIPTAFIEIVDGHEAEVEQIIAELKEMSLRELPERDVALDYRVIEKIPMTENEKPDFVSLENDYQYDVQTLTRQIS